jgi:hypothetical protein
MVNNVYGTKIMDFINDSQVMQTPMHPTKSYQETVKNSVNKCNKIVLTNKKLKLCDLNSELSYLKGFIKVH